MAESNRVIRDFLYWTIYLHPNQCYLGRCIIALKRQSVTDLLEISSEEREELFNIAKVLRLCLSALFKPDLFNYASLGNVDPALHIHLIPRYKEPRVFDSLNFTDTNWGKNYSPYDKSFVIPQETFDLLILAICRELQKYDSNLPSIKLNSHKLVKRSNKLRSYRLDLIRESLGKRESYISFIEFLVTSGVTIGGALAALLNYEKVYLPLFVLGELLILISITLGVLVRNKILNTDMVSLNDNIEQSTNLLSKYDNEIIKLLQAEQINKADQLEQIETLQNAIKEVDDFMNNSNGGKVHNVTTTHISWLLITGLLVIFLSFFFSSVNSAQQYRVPSLQFSGSGTIMMYK
jgi:diadenosine tetraphosphate (Ap4A) HIT family hydrolase